MSQTLKSDAPRDHDELGAWVTRCGPKGKSSIFGMLILFAFMMVGLLCLLSGATRRPEPGSESLSVFIAGAGIVMLLIGAACLVYLMLERKPQVDLYAGGVRFKTRAVQEYIRWDRMRDVEIVTIYDTRFSSYRRVCIRVRGLDKMEFDSRVKGNPHRVIEAIEHFAPQVRTKEISLG